MDEWPVVKLSAKKIEGLSLLYAAARYNMMNANRPAAEIRLTEYFDAIENLIDKSVRNPLDHTKAKK